MNLLLLLLIAINCRFETNPPGFSKFLWKPNAEHFTSQAVILPHQTYYSKKAKVELFAASNEERIEAARLKDEKYCDGDEECLKTISYLTAYDGLHYRKKYRSIIVRVSERGKEKRCFRIPRPGKRTEYRG